MDLNIIASNFSLHRYLTEDIITISNQLLEKGYSSDSLYKLVIEENVSKEIVESLFKEALIELGIVIPESKEAVKSILHHSLSNIVNKKIDPIQGIKSLVDGLLKKIKLHEESDNYLGDFLGIEKLLSAYYSLDDINSGDSSVSYDGLYGEKALVQIENDIVALSKQWLERNASP